jgi:hypothetical protein
MIRESITIEDALVVLNRAFQADPMAMDALSSARVPCNSMLADDPEIQVASRMTNTDGGRPVTQYAVGFLGIINGLFGIDEETHYGAIAMDYEVKCPRNCLIEDDTLAVGDECPKCKSELVLGDLLGFFRVDHGDVKKRQDENALKTVHDNND